MRASLQRDSNKQRWLCPAGPPLTHNHGPQILDNLSYSLRHKPWIQKREESEKKAGGCCATTQAVFTPSPYLLALTDYPATQGPALVFDSVWFVPPSLCLFFSLCLSVNAKSLMVPSDEDLKDLPSGWTGAKQSLTSANTHWRHKEELWSILSVKGNGLNLKNHLYARQT